jgi:putative ABC transport system substrate-binding protein
MTIGIGRRQFVAALGGATVAWPLAARAEDAPRVRVGWALGVPEASPQIVAFERRMAELGYVKGQNLAMEYIYTEGRPDRYAEATQELLRRKIDILIAAGTESALKSATAATQTVPIVMTAIDYDPVALGYVTSLARPAGNVTGFFFQQIELTVKRLQIFKDAFPDMRAATVFWDRNSADQLRAASNASAGMALRLEGVEFRDPPYDYERGIDGVSPDARHFLIVLTSGLFIGDRARIAAFALNRGMASMFSNRIEANAGGLMSYGPNLVIIYARVAEYVDRIARGARPMDLPIEQPTKFELVLNLKTAKALGLAIPPTFLVRADEVIE